jgi:hypothetical protein
MENAINLYLWKPFKSYIGYKKCFETFHLAVKESNGCSYNYTQLFENIREF